MQWSPSVERQPSDPPRKKVAVIGFSSSSRDMAPWFDPDWELWGMNQGYEHFRRKPDRWFELHDKEHQPDASVPTYLDDLTTLGCPIYMLEVDISIPRSVRYPLENVLKMGPRYFTSTAAYMVGLAITLGVEEIGLYGVDCSVGSEYEYQKPCLEWWMGVAAGRGIRVTVPETSALLKAPFLYGYEPSREWPRSASVSLSFLDARIADRKVMSNEILTEWHRQEGAIQEAQEIRKFVEAASRGSQFGILNGQV